MSPERKRVGIVACGGPAPGINSAISAVSIEAINSGLDVIGIYDGFQHISQGHVDHILPLSIAQVSRIHFQGGSIIRTSRSNPMSNPEDFERCVATLRQMGISYLVTIGGDGTASAAAKLARVAKGEPKIVHLPKTIDNDLPLPGGMPTFGFETARHVGSEMVRNLMEDSRSTGRWFFVVVMGRVAGHLALGIGQSTGATLTVIPEEFSEEPIGLGQLCDVLEGAILKRKLMGRQHGVVVIAEGIAGKLDQGQLSKVPGVSVERDAFGNLSLGDIPLATILKREVEDRFAARGEDLSIVDETLGYVLRSAAPIPFDIDYTRTLGYGAVRCLLAEPSDERLRVGGLICLQEGHLLSWPFENIWDTDTDRVRVRKVDVQSEHYKVACKYMIRIENQDLEDADMLAKLAVVAKTTPEEFLQRFSGFRLRKGE